LNTHAWNDGKSDNSSDGCNEDLEQVPHEYSVGDFNAEMGRDVLKPRVGNECTDYSQQQGRVLTQVSIGHPVIVQCQASPCGQCCLCRVPEKHLEHSETRPRRK